MQRNYRWLYFATTAILVLSFFTYGYKLLAAEEQKSKAIEIFAQDGPEGLVLRSLSDSLAGGGFLGVELADISSSDLEPYGLSKEEGVLIRKVEKGSPAADAGLLAEDIVVSFSGTPVLSAAQFRRLVNETPAGRTISITVLRQKKKVDLQVKVGKRADTLKSDLLRKLPEVQDLPQWEHRSSPEEFYLKRLPGKSFTWTTQKPRLGIGTLPLTDQLAAKFGVKDGGVLVTEVAKDSVAAKAGLSAGDIILAIDGTPVADTDDIVKALNRNEGKAFDIKILRDQKPQTLKAQLPEPEPKAKKKSGSSVEL